MTIRHSLIQSNMSDGHGGGIYNHGQLAISHSTVQQNRMPLDYNSGGGGGIYNGGAMAILQVDILQNIATGDGGGVANIGWLTIENSQITQNQTNNNGGGLSVHPYLPYEPTRVTVLNTNINNNIVVDGEGGGIYSNEETFVTLQHSSVTANAKGGIYTMGTLWIGDSTIGGHSGYGVQSLGGQGSNVNFTRSSIVYNTGYGIYNELGSMGLTHTVIAQNGTDCNSARVLQSFGYNLIQANESSCPISGNISTHLPFGTDPLIDSSAIQNEIGTFAYPLLENSPLIDAGTVPCDTNLDQRNFLRPFDGDENGTAVCDIGAYEYGEFTGIDQTTYLPIIRNGEADEAIPATGNARLSQLPNPQQVGITMGALGASLVLGLVLLQSRQVRKEEQEL